MSPKKIANAVIQRHPELKRLSPKHLKLVKVVIEEAPTLSSQEVLSPEETDRFLKSRVPDFKKPSLALRAYRNRADMTQRELAEKSSIPQPHIAAMESGKRTIGLMAAKKLAAALGVDHRKLV